MSRLPGRIFSARRWACLLGMVLGAGAGGGLDALIWAADPIQYKVVYPGGMQEVVEVVVVEGIEHLPLKELDRLLRVVDEGARLTPRYDPISLDIDVVGKRISISVEFMTIAQQIKRPRHDLRLEDSEFLIPLDTVKLINESLKLFSEFSLPSPEIVQGSLAEPGGLLEPMLPEEPILPFEDPVASLAFPESPFAPEEAAPAPFAPIEEAGSLGIVLPPSVLAIAPVQLASLLEREPFAAIRRVAIVPEAGSKELHGPHADEVGKITTRMAFLIQTYLEETGNYEVRIPNQPFGSQEAKASVEWANNSQCDVMIALTVEASPFRTLTGIRLWTSHKAGDAAARPIEKGAAYGLAPAFNYLPYQDHSLLMAGLIHRELSRSRSVKTHPLEIAPCFLLRRVAMPAALVSLGYVTTDSERRKMGQPEFGEQVAKAILSALNKMREMNAGGVG